MGKYDQHSGHSIDNNRVEETNLTGDKLTNNESDPQINVEYF